MGDIEVSFDLGLILKWGKRLIFFGFLIAVLVFELSVTLNSPIAFGDEGFHVANARYMGTQIEYPLNTPLFGTELQQEKFSRPPLWNLIEASFYMIFGFHDVIVKFLLPFISFMTGLTIYVFLRKLYDENLGIIAAAIAVTIPSFVTYSIFFYTTVPYVFFFTIAFFCLLAAVKTGGRKFWLLAGIFSGIAILTNIAGAFLIIITALVGILSLIKNRKMATFRNVLKTYGVVIFLSLLLISPWVLRNVALYKTPGCDNIMNIIQGACPTPNQYQQQTDKEFTGRTSGGGTEESILNVGIVNYLRFAYGSSNSNNILNIIGFALVPFSFLAGMMYLAKRKDMSDILVMVAVIVFLVLSFFVGGLFEGRSEDTARYFLSAVPIIALAAGTFWANVKKEGHKFGNLLVFAVIVVILSLLFVGFAQKAAQLDNIKDFVPSFFQACDWVKNNLPEDANMLSLNTYPTRYNCERAAIWEIPDKADIILTNDLDLVKQRLHANGINYIFVQKFALSNEAFGQSYPVSFVDFLESNNRTFANVYENGPIYGTQEFSTCISTSGCDPGNIIYKVLD